MPDSVPHCALRISDNAHDGNGGRNRVYIYKSFNMKKQFMKPEVLQTMEVLLEENLLGDSQITEMESSVDSMGQERKEEAFTASDNLWYD